MDPESRRREREKCQHLGLRRPGQPRCAPLAGREGSEEARGSPEKKRGGRGREERLESDQTSRPRVQLLFTSRFHQIPLEAYSKFPFCQAGLSYFLLFKTENILNDVVSHRNVLSPLAWMVSVKKKARKGWEGLMEAPLSETPIKPESRDLLRRVRSQEP